jgi:hypothetical protein
MIEKKIRYKESDLVKHLKKLGLTEKEIKNILKKGASQKITERKHFDSGGDGGGDGGSSGGDGSSGDGSSGDGEGSSSGSGGGVGGDDGAAASAAGDAGVGTGDSAGVGGSGDSTGSTGVGSGPGGEEGTGGVSAAADAASQGTGVMSTLSNFARNAFNTYMSISPTAIAMNAISNAISNAQRGVTAPNDFSQATQSVQTSAPTQSPGGGSSYLPINANTGIPSLSVSSDLVDDFYNRYKTNLNRFK